MKFYITIVFVFTSIYSQNIISFFAGSEFLIGKSSSQYSVEDIGLNLGFLLPINTQTIDIHYKVRATFHDAFLSSNNGTVTKHYISATNALLLGQRMDFNDLAILPQAGIGMTLETIYTKFGDGTVFDIIFLDLSVLIDYPLLKYHLGLLLNFEHGFYTSNNNYAAKNRLNLGLVLSL